MTQSAVETLATTLLARAVEAGENAGREKTEQLGRALHELERGVAALEALVQRMEEKAAAVPSVAPPAASEPPAVPPDEDDTQRDGAAAPVLPEKWDIASLCRQHGLEIIDRREVPGGSLWVVGRQAVARPLLRLFAAEGIAFTYAPTGSRATQRRPGWFTKSHR